METFIFVVFSTVWLLYLLASSFGKSITFQPHKQEDFKTMCSSGLLIYDTVIINCVVDYKYIGDVEYVTYASFEIEERSEAVSRKLFAQNVQASCENHELNFYNCTEIAEHVVYFSFKLIAIPAYIGAKVIGILQIKSTVVIKEVQNFPEAYVTTDAMGVFSANKQNYSSEDCRINITSIDLHVRFDCLSHAKPCLIQMIINGSRPINATDFAESIVTLGHQEIVNVEIRYAVCRLDQEIKYFNCEIKYESRDNTFHDYNKVGAMSLIIGTTSILIVALGLAVVIFLKRRELRNNRRLSFCCPPKSNGLERRAHFLKDSIKNDPDVNVTEPDEQMAVDIASLKGQTVNLEWLKENEENVNIKNKSGNYPLTIASKYGETEKVIYFIEKGSEVNQTTKRGNTALHLASKKGCTDIVKILIKNGANVNLKNNNGKSPLTMASFFGHMDIAVCLIENGAEVDNGNNEGNTALHLSSKKGFTDIVKLLISKKANVNLKGVDDYTPLIFASESGHNEIVEYLIEHEAEINHSTNEGNTALHLASKEGFKDIVLLLKEKGADVNLKNKNGQSPLSMA